MSTTRCEGTCGSICRCRGALTGDPYHACIRMWTPGCLECEWEKRTRRRHAARAQKQAGPTIMCKIGSR
jgi:hypothetical protein